MTAQVLSYSAGKMEGEGDLDTWVPEQALLAACLSHKDCWPIAAEHVRPEDFSDALHARMFERMGRLHGEGRPINPVSLYTLMKGDIAVQREVMTEEDLRKYIVDIAMARVGIMPQMVIDWAVCIRTFARRRLVRDRTQSLAAGNLDRPLTDIAADLSSLATGLGEGISSIGVRSLGVATLAALDIAQAAYKAGGGLSGVATGFLDLDAILGGLAPSDLTILGGRPSMGKTALGLNIAHNAAKAGKSVAVFSLEMSAEQLALRILAGMTGMSSDSIRRGDITDLEIERLIDAQRKLDRMPLDIDDTAAASVQKIRLAAEKVKRRRGLDLILVDYLQLVRPDRERESRTVDITEVSAGLKGIAKALNVPVVALAQLSRAVEQRDDKRPQLSDLRDSGAIEQDADQVLFLYRDEYYATRTEPEPSDRRYEEWRARMDRSRGLAEVIIAKNRHGKIGDVKLTFDARRQLFTNHYEAA